ncbi:MAG: replicative DNA helicase [Candidatus Taylorbacteria bacterium RIFCSPHIGHO2_01_FULL_46_22b]|uniref:Replicative DNA helicase n=1 Tax=Candidatus Taylorbacteria bacterium RIFCSPHIGHO2_01_FULL_46_22b TaxID=1802301 RepID=A0A1G2M3C7_9BACT|nr:MAG: replicative DNA helicase [Candidatus Taylorbacteria bacterium RIFCSPHIGHO2_01_FULL_46_22b]
MAKQAVDITRIPPQNIQAEQALLGSILLQQDTLNDCLDIVAAHSFYAEKHRLIFETMLEMFGKGTPIDLLSLTSRLDERGLIERSGGASYIAELAGSVPTSINAKHYAEIVQKKYLMRQLIDASEHIRTLGYDEEQEMEHLLDNAEKKLFEVTNVSGKHKFVELKDMLGDAWERIDHLNKTRGELRGVPTGFKELDGLLAGLQKSDLIILAARPSMGKTALALDIARQTAINHNISVGIFSLEMSAQQLVDRMLAAQSRVNAWGLRTGHISQGEDFNRIRDALDVLAKAPIYIDDQPGQSIIKMRSVARKLKREKKLGLIVVDYLQLMLSGMKNANDSFYQQVTEISRSLKQLARELEVPVLALSQLSRAVEQRGGKPRLSDLRDSGSIEQDADVVMFIHREDKYKDDSDKPNIAEIMVEKHRNGPTGKVELYFDEKKTTFLSIEKADLRDFGGATPTEAQTF